MKLPLWYKDKQGKWHPFPHELLQTDARGRQYLTAMAMVENPELWKINPKFDHDVAAARYIWYLKEGK